MVTQGITFLSETSDQAAGQTVPHSAKQQRRNRRVGHELSKTGMIASLTVIALTGFRILKPMLPLHPLAGMAFIGFALWHVYQKDHRVVHLKHPAHGKREPVD
ncbi:MAG: hypothetical protein H7839_03630 [Magnetococcus sp. YQC-5]